MSLLFVAALFIPGRSYARNQLACEAEVEAFKSAIERSDSAGIRTAFPRVFSCFPEGLGQVTEEAEEWILGRGMNRIGPSLQGNELDTLMRIYDAAIQVRQKEQAKWKLRRAMVAWQYRKVLRLGANEAVLAAFDAAPGECPLLLLEAVLEIQSKAFEKRKISPPQWILVLAQMDRAISLRMRRNPDEVEGLSEFRENQFWEVVNSLPNCSKTSMDRVFGHSKDPVPPEMVRQEIWLNHLHGCNNNEATYRRSVQNAGDLLNDAWWMDLAAGISIDQDHKVQMLRKFQVFQKNRK